jgi:hypothetical protein
MLARGQPILSALLVGVLAVVSGCHGEADDIPMTAGEHLPTADGYRGLWYANMPIDDEYRFKYSGGAATYPHQHHPLGYYAPAVDKTFFVYGGVDESGSLLHMVSFFDHARGEVPRPVILLDKGTTDAHDNPSLMLDDDGYLWVFSSSHGTSRPSFIHRSREPYSIEAFDLVRETNFSYAQPWFISGQGWCFLHTLYEDGGRSLYVGRSADGQTWPEPNRLARAELGHYQVSWRHGTKLGTAFNLHPDPGGLNKRTNLYYMETDDGGQTWHSASGEPVSIPIDAEENAALVADYRARDLLVYLKQVRFDDGLPVLLYLTAPGWRPGPGNDPRTWMVSRFDGAQWQTSEITTSDHNYDYGSLYVQGPTWSLLAPTRPGPQPYSTGGELALWTSVDRGATWQEMGPVTQGSAFNHSYVRTPVDAHPEFAALWTDGNGLESSPSRLYFTDAAASAVWQLPTMMLESSEPPLRYPQ